MTATVSFLPLPAAQSSAPANPPAPAAENSSTDAPFSRMLDRAVQEPPSRKNKTPLSERQNPTRPGAISSKQSKQSDQTAPSDEAKSEGEAAPRQTPRLKSKKSERDEAENLAGACGGTVPTTLAKEAVAQGEPDGATNELAAVSNQGSGETVAANTAEPVLATALETTTSNELNPVTLVAPTETGAAETKDQSLVAALRPAVPTETPTTKLLPTENPASKPGDAASISTLELNRADATAPTSGAPEQRQSLITATENEVPLTASLADFTPDEISSEPTEMAAPTAAGAGVEAPDSAPEEIRRSVRAVRRARLEALETAAGIGGAKSSETMKTVAKKEELAGGTEQFLPVSSPNALSALRNLPGELNRKGAGLLSAPDALEAAAKTATLPAHSAVATEGEALFIRPNSAMARISEVVSREIRMFKRSGDDLVEVVLTPDTKTQISLRLQWREGQVEVQARCDLGDYQSLNTQWPQLQASLAGHGVRLSHLSERVTTGFTEFFNNPNFAQQRGREEPRQNSPSTADSLPPLPAPQVKPAGDATGRRSNRLFDSWA